MAKLDPTPYPGFEKPWDKDPDYWKRPQVGRAPDADDDFQAQHDAETAKVNEMTERSDNLPPGEIVGAMLQFPIADGYAVYVVTKARPLTLQHVNYCDGYSIPGAHVRGITKADVLAQIERRKKMAALFARRATP